MKLALGGTLYSYGLYECDNNINIVKRQGGMIFIIK